ncbi:hypothetical protein [Mucilaginibacter xinganensis]|uniref:Gliding motility protein GldL n=1 Tax=Mucilaginibacter xinganensis TaxID=1234841 RepID=A0A223NSI8_9SPHI|nr:hypothetical protein [Mucilaginibacter xinganensis]ASU32786.1 hypothetical protein MuYL_0886 [Mucilaginibacter xinganensis]
MNSTENANAEGHYKLMVLAIAIGLTGVFLRFGDFHYASIISNIILIIGVLIALKSVFAILK